MDRKPKAVDDRRTWNVGTSKIPLTACDGSHVVKDAGTDIDHPPDFKIVSHEEYIPLHEKVKVWYISTVQESFYDQQKILIQGP